MKAVVLALVITWAALLPQTAAMAQTAPAQRSEVSVIYVPPKNPPHQPIYEQLKEIRFLGKVREAKRPSMPPPTVQPALVLWLLTIVLTGLPSPSNPKPCPRSLPRRPRTRP
jgi:hypothetical protein